jgi:hypothetical protein
MTCVCFVGEKSKATAKASSQGDPQVSLKERHDHLAQVKQVKASPQVMTKPLHTRHYTKLNRYTL